MTPMDGNPSVHPPRRLQFSLRWLLVFTTAVALILSIGRCLGDRPTARIGQFLPQSIESWPGAWLLGWFGIAAIVLLPAGNLAVGIYLLKGHRVPSFLCLWWAGTVSVITGDVLPQAARALEEPLLGYGFLAMVVGVVFAAGECVFRRLSRRPWLFLLLAVVCTLSVFVLNALVQAVGKAVAEAVAEGLFPTQP